MAKTSTQTSTLARRILDEVQDTIEASCYLGEREIARLIEEYWTPPSSATLAPASVSDEAIEALKSFLESTDAITGLSGVIQAQRLRRLQQVWSRSNPSYTPPR